jgi:hypothetical protein
MLVLYFMQMNCDRLHGRLLVSHYLVVAYSPAHPLLGQTLTYYVLLYSYSHYICDVMLASERRNEIRHEVTIT